ncbi:von Willebrand factor A domain-containing protein 7-like [Oscarella lobularis]|uniref:von Willebrand factor A domain-containing protein 7-like n=1 Tax=Oscarella lobularis TaxID=121494 RepID=UPI00331338FC
MMMALGPLLLLVVAGIANAFVPTAFNEKLAGVADTIFGGSFSSTTAGSTTHIEMTTAAMAQVGRALLQKRRLLPASFTSDDPNEIVRAAFGNPASAEDFVAAIATVTTANADVDAEDPDSTAAHFDAENFLVGNERLLALYSAAVRSVVAGEYDDARTSIGQLLHGLQDFYSHSNWIELGNTKPNENLAIRGRQPTNIAPPRAPTCQDCPGGFLTLRRESCRNNLVTSFITSGYYPKQDRQKPDAKDLIGGGANDEGKCSHGGVLDVTSLKHATGGINKDSTSAIFSPHNYLHQDAALVATAATVALLNSLWDRFDNDRFTRFMGLDYGATISFVFDTTSTLRDDMIEAYRQMSTSFANSPSLRPSDFFFVPFNDQDFGGLYRTRIPADFENKISSAKTSVSSASESLAVSGLILALRSSKKGSTIYLFTDNGAKDFNRYPEAVALFSAKRVKVVVVVGNSSLNLWRPDRGIDSHSIYNYLAEVSGGQVLSEITSKTGHALRLASSFVDATDISLAQYESTTPSGPFGVNVTVTVDDLVTNMTVSLSGRNPSLRLTKPNGQAPALEQDDVAQTGNAAFAVVHSPDRGSWTVQVINTESRFDLLVKGTSSLNFVPSLVQANFNTSHPGMFPILGQPRIGDLVTVRLSVNGLPDGGTVDKVLLVLENTTVVGEYTTVLFDDTTDNILYVTQGEATVPAEPFNIAISGQYNGRTFVRLAYTLITPVAFKVETVANSRRSVKQGNNLGLQFVVSTANIEAEYLDITVEAEDLLGLTGAPQPSSFRLAANSSETVAIEVAVPTCFPLTSLDGVVIVVRSQTTNETSSFLKKIFVDSQFNDYDPPVCFVDYVNSTSCTPNDCTGNWTSSVTILDKGSHLDSIGVESSTASISHPDLSTSRNAFVTATVTASCCTESVTVNVADASGNQATCTPMKTSTTESNCDQAPCLNGGRCQGPNSCLCLGGYFGNNCSQEGCQKPSAPLNGVLNGDATAFQEGQLANFSCTDPFELTGDNLLTCCPFGWAGSTPFCLSSGSTVSANSMIVTFVLVLGVVVWRFMAH